MDREKALIEIYRVLNPQCEHWKDTAINIAIDSESGYVRLLDWHLSEIAKAKTSLLREIIKTIDANNLEGIDREWFEFKLKCLEENKGDE